MIEAYRHLKRYPDADFCSRIFDLNCSDHYKTVVGRETAYCNIHKYDASWFKWVYALNCEKLQVLLSDSKSTLADRLYNLLNVQVDAVKSMQPYVWVITTVLMFLSFFKDIFINIPDMQNTADLTAKTNVFN